MAASNEWFDFHLTPRGWEMGSNKTDSTPTETVAPPEDRVLTIRVSERMPSSISKIDRREEEIWRSPDGAQVTTLIKRYGASPN